MFYRLKSSSSYSHGITLFDSIFSLNETYTSSFYECIIDFGSCYHMDKDNAIFSYIKECNTKTIFVCNDISLSVLGSKTVQVNNGHLNDVLYVPSLSYNLLLVYLITHSGEGKTIEFSPH